MSWIFSSSLMGATKIRWTRSSCTARMAIAEAAVELFADFVRESGDFAGGRMSPSFHMFMIVECYVS